jgi:hypothetical protein
VCRHGYEGRSCETDLREKFLGKWTGQQYCDQVGSEFEFAVERNDDTSLKIVFPGANSPSYIIGWFTGDSIIITDQVMTVYPDSGIHSTITNRYTYGHLYFADNKLWFYERVEYTPYGSRMGAYFKECLGGYVRK